MFLGTLTSGLLAALLTAESQQAGRVVRIGAVSAGAPRSSPHWVAFAQRLGELGYAEGRNVSIEFRSAEGRPERFPDLMSELVRLGVDVILPVGPEASLRAAQKATMTVPIVVVAIDYDPVARGYVRGLARPGTNTTGVFLRQPELTPKRIELLKEVVPEVRRVVVFWDAFSADQLKEAELAARSAGLQLQRFEFPDPPYLTLPAASNSSHTVTISVSVSRSPASSTAISALIRSSRESARRAAIVRCRSSRSLQRADTGARRLPSDSVQVHHHRRDSPPAHRT
jgi:ABC-type uncharacterized transport system substrate-binding protein